MTIEKIQSERGIELPEAYLQLLANLDAGEDFCFNEYPDEDPDFEGRCWSFLDEELLQENIEMRGVGNAPAHKQIELYLKCYQEFSNGNSVSSTSGNIPITRVSDGFVIAEENGDFLYLDPQDNFSVWIFHHDSSDVVKVSNSISDWLACATIS